MALQRDRSGPPECRRSAGAGCRGRRTAGVRRGELAVRNGALTWNDQASGRALALTELDRQRPPRRPGRRPPRAERAADPGEPGDGRPPQRESSYRLDPDARPAQLDARAGGLHGQLAGQPDDGAGAQRVPRLKLALEGASAGIRRAVFRQAGQQLPPASAASPPMTASGRWRRPSSTGRPRGASHRYPGGPGRLARRRPVFEFTGQGDELTLTPEAGNAIRKIALRTDAASISRAGQRAGQLELQA